MSANSATLTVDDKHVELAVKTGTIGPSVIDISKLYGQTGMFTYDPGFTSTASCESKITYIDGDEGVLLYRGYPIEQLAEHGDFLETCYLLLYGELPTAAQKADFDYRVTRHTMVHEQMTRFFQGFRRDAHPMAVMVACVGALSAFYHDFDRHLGSASAHGRLDAHDRQDADARRDGLQVFDRPALRLSAERSRLHRRTSCACASRCRARNTRSTRCSSRALDRIFILHADHEQNASTSTVRLAGSSGANPFACIAAGIACLWGPAHGGANEAALKMLEEIGTPDRIPQYIAKAKDKNDPFRLMGFGHRVYKNYDPRAKIMQKTTHEVLNELGIKDDPLLDVAMELEQIALKDEYFIEKKLYPNIDFYSGITLKAMGFPTSMFTVLFALARTVGWIAQWKRDDRGPVPADRPPAPALYRRAAARLRDGRPARVNANVDIPGPRKGSLELAERMATSRQPLITVRLYGFGASRSVRPGTIAAKGFRARSSAAARLARHLVADPHQLVELRERLDLRRRSGVSREERQQRIGELLRRAIPLDQFRDDVLAEHQVGEHDRGCLDEVFQDLPRASRPGRRRPSARRRGRAPASPCRRPRGPRRPRGRPPIWRPRPGRSSASRSSFRRAAPISSARCGTAGIVTSNGRGDALLQQRQRLRRTAPSAG